MEWVASRQPTTGVLAVRGRLDASSADAFEAALSGQLEQARTDGIATLVLDFAAVDYISSAGLRALMLGARRARSAGVGLRVAGMQSLVAEIFRISRFDTFIAAHASLAEALAAAALPANASASAPATTVPGAAPRATAHAPGPDGIRVRFWGTRGSLPTPMPLASLRDKLAAALVAGAGQSLDTLEKAHAFVSTLPFEIGGTHGGNSPCVELSSSGDRVVLLDMGSGARLAGADALRRLDGRPGEFHVFMSHLHWDHIMGFPFFAPAYIPGQRIRIHGCHPQLEEAFRRQQAEPSFPVPFSRMGADISFDVLEPERDYDIAGYQVRASLQLHGGDSYGYRFTRDGKTVVYSTDAEHKPEQAEDARRFVALFRDADLVVFDAMYSLADSVSIREDWGHSSNVAGVELCQKAGARRLALFHHEPVNDDAAISRLLQEARRLEQLTRAGAPLDIVAAYDGLELDA
jgi:anti-anti-sigma factor